MQNNSISARNTTLLMTLMSMSSVLMSGFSKVGHDMWISMLFAVIMAVPFALMYARIVKANPGKGLYDIIDTKFSKFISIPFIVLMTVYSILVSALVTENFAEFINCIALPRTPKFYVMAGMYIIGAYLAKAGPNVMGKWSFFVFVVITANLFATAIFAIRVMDYSVLFPLMEHGFENIVSSGWSIAAIAFGELIIAASIMGGLKSGESPYKAYIMSLLITGLVLVCMILRNALILGEGIVSSSLFPSYIALRIVAPGTFLEHIESIVSINLILAGITKIAVCLKSASLGAEKILNVKAQNNMLVTPIAFLGIAICMIAFSNMYELIEFVGVYRYISIPFSVIIPLILWIKSEIDLKKSGKNVSKPQKVKGTKIAEI